MKPQDYLSVMLYDGNCVLCQYWIEKWRKVTGGFVRYEPYQKILKDYPQITEEECRKAVQLILPDGTRFSGAHAVFKALELSGKDGPSLWCYEHLPLFGRISEWGYQIVAHSRGFLSRLYGAPKCKRAD